MATTFTLLGPADTERLVGLVDGWHRADRLAFDPERARVALSRLLADTRLGHAWTIGHAGEDIGYLIMTFAEPAMGGEPKAYVSALYLAPEWRGKGKGAQALGFVQEVAHWLQVRLFTFDVDGERKHAHLLSRPSQRILQSNSQPRQAVA
jgi:GNAT superfamily N-acetyltransferase